MSSGGGDSGTTEIRYAPYVEQHHENFLIINHEYLDQQRNDGYNPYSTIFQESQAAIDAKPPADVDWMDAFFGSGYTISSYPSLYDMYGKFLAGLDVEVLWVQELENTQDNSAISALTNAHADVVRDEIVDEVVPKYRAGLRDINAINASSYYIGLSNIWGKYDNSIERFDAELRYKLIPIAAERWLHHMNWNQNVIKQYMEVIRLSLQAQVEENDHKYKNRLAYVMWPWTLLEQYRANLGALQGATTSKAGQPSQTQSAIGGALTGAAAGYMVTQNPIGAVIGGALGIASSFF